MMWPMPSKASVLVTGGAGYIGSHATHKLLQQGYEVTVVDDLSQGHQQAVPEGRLVQLNLEQEDKLADLMEHTRCRAVLHFAASASVADSMQNPTMYFTNNVVGSLSLLSAMERAGVKLCVFSSSAAVYGIPKALPIRESDPIKPISPY